MHEAFTHLAHRPWPCPTGPWTWRQNWLDLLFAHWPIRVEHLQPLVPSRLTLQEFEGTAWVGVVPFRMTGVMRRPLPDLPGVSAFPELNLRLYVEHQGRPGVWFVSLDATNWLAVQAARWLFHLPYHHARMAHRGELLSASLEPTSAGIVFESQRVSQPPTVTFRAAYRAVGSTFTAQPGTLEHFLCERYCLYAVSPRGTLFRCDVHHRPWPLYRAEAEIQADELLARYGLKVEDRPPHVLATPGVHTVVWNPTAV
jgi:uncharacterized protein